MLDLDSETYATYLGPYVRAAAPLILPYSEAPAEAGFPLPTLDYLDAEVDLGQLLVPNPLASYLYRASGWSMLLAGIIDGSILVVDRSVKPQENDVVIASWDGCQPVCKILRIHKDHISLESRNPHHKTIELPPGTEVEVFFVRAVAHVLRRG